MIRFLAPELLLLAAPLAALVALWGRRSRGGLDPRRAQVTLGLRLLVVLGLVLALAEPEWRSGAGGMRVAVVVDRSRSVPQDRRALADQVLAAVQAARPVDGRGVVVACAADAVTEAALGPGAGPVTWRSVLDPQATDLQAGIEAALRGLGEEGRARIVLLSDGLENRGQALEAALRARREGVPVDVVPLEWTLAADLRVEKVALPAQVRPGEPFLARVIVQALQPAQARVRLQARGAILAEREVTLVAGANLVELEARLSEPGLADLEAVVAALDPAADQRPQNDRAFGFTLVPGERRVVHLTAEPGDAAHATLHAALEGEGLRVVGLTPAEAPLAPGGWEGVDAVLLHDVPREAFSSGQVEALCAAVADQGVGLLALGGPEAFAAGGWAGTPLEDALPVRLLPSDPSVMPDTGLVIVIDRSGSMSGEKIELARAAAVAAAELLTGQDQVGVVAFSSEAEWAARMGPGGRGAIGALRGLDAGGGTFMEPALRLAHEGLRGSAAAVKHVIVLSDGQSEGDPGELIRACLRMGQAGITVTTVSVGADSDRALLRRMAAVGGGKHLPVDRPRDLPRVFTREVQRVARGLIAWESFQPQVHTLAPYLRGCEAPPALRARVRLAEPKPRATVALTAPDGEPVLADWQLGLGRAAAFASDPRPGWAGDWTGWDGQGKLWAQLVRWVARDLEERAATLTVTRRGGRARVALDALDATGQPVRGRVYALTVRDPQGDAQEVPLRPVGDGRWEGEFAADQAGVYAVAARSSDGARARPEGVTGLAVPVAEELRPTAWDALALRTLAESSGGAWVRPFDLIDGRWDAWDPRGLVPRGGSQPLWPALLALAAGAFLLDVAARRVAIDARQLFARGPVSSGNGLAEGRAPAPAPSPAPASAPPPGDEPPGSPPPGDVPPGAGDAPGQDLASRLRQAKERARRRLDG